MRANALGALGSFDDGLAELRAEFAANPDKMRSLQNALSTGQISSDEEDEEEVSKVEAAQDSGAQSTQHHDDEEEEDDDEYEARMLARRNSRNSVTVSF